MVLASLLRDKLELPEVGSTPATPDTGERRLAALASGGLRSVNDAGATEDYKPQVFPTLVPFNPFISGRIVEGNTRNALSFTAGNSYFSGGVNSAMSFGFDSYLLYYQVQSRIEWVVTLDEGDWYLLVYHGRTTNAGNWGFYLDGELLGSVVGYASVNTNNHQTQINFTLAKAGTYLLELRPSTHPASSENYFILTGFAFFNTDLIP